MAQLASLRVPISSIPQQDVGGWLSGLADTVIGGMDRYTARRDTQTAIEQSRGTPSTPQRGFLSGLLTGNDRQRAETHAAPVMPVERGPMQGDTYKPFMSAIRAGGVTNPNALAAIAATGRAESGWSAANANRTWSDPSESGQAGTAGGIMSWRGPRYQALAATGDLSPEGQARFFLQEDPNLIAALNAAKTPEEAADLMANAWKFAGYNRPGGEAARRRAMARNYYAQEYSRMPNDAAAAIEAVAPSGGFDSGRFGDVIMPAQGTDQLASALAQANTDGIQTGSTSDAPMEIADASGSAMPSGSNMLAQGVTPVQRGSIDPALLARLVTNPQSREFGLKLWQQNVTGSTGEPWQFVTLPDGTLARANQQTGSVERVGNFGKKQELPNSYQEFQLAQRDGFKGTYADWQKVKTPGTSVTVNNGEGDKFYEALDKKNAETFSMLSEGGIGARGRVAQLGQLETLLRQSPSGAEAGIKLWLGDMGINSDGLDSLQATRALIEKMVPEQRQPGSGPMSDADIVMYRRSLASALNQPGGNELVIGAAKAIAEYDMQMGEIADAVADREIPPSEGRRRIRELKNPLAGYTQKLREIGVNGIGNKGNRTPSGLPSAGAVVDGYKFKGGDPADPNSWERQ